MDLVTSKHGLAPLKSAPGHTEVDLSSLSLELKEELKKLEKDFTVDSNKLKEISKRFEEELQDGLDKYGSNISMNVTWVLGFPNGHEQGDFLTVDLGGTNIRVCWITLKERKGETEITQDQYKLPDEIKTGNAEQLWSFVGESLESFITKHDLKGTREKPLRLGFTFSYPAHQEYIDHGKLVTWTKGFEIKGVEGEDAAGQLREAIDKRENLPIEIVALINDTTGAMIASAYKDPETIIGAIFGTGCNAAYMESVSAIKKLDTNLAGDTPMAINCEYGAFDNAHRILPRTKYDIAIDEDSPKPGEQAFEKMSAGLYLGEVLRHIYIELHDRGLLFRDQDISKLKEPYIMDTSFLSTLENDSPPEYPESKSELKDILGLDANQEELAFSHRLAQLIGNRAARLCTCGVVAICNKTGVQSGHVAADGSVANKHPTFKKRWAEAMAEVLGWPDDRKEDPITITPAEDGSGIGAAVISAMTIQRAEKGNLAGIQNRATGSSKL